MPQNVRLCHPHQIVAVVHAVFHRQREERHLHLIYIITHPILTVTTGHTLKLNNTHIREHFLESADMPTYIHEGAHSPSHKTTQSHCTDQRRKMTVGGGRRGNYIYVAINSESSGLRQSFFTLSRWLSKSTTFRWAPDLKSSAAVLFVSSSAVLLLKHAQQNLIVES